LDLAAGREALVEPLALELPLEGRPRLELPLERREQVGARQQLGIDRARDVARDADQRLERDVACDHRSLVVAPALGERALRRPEHVAQEAEAALVAPAAPVAEALLRL